MKGYTNILVPVDGSKTAEAVLPEIEKLIEAFGSRIHILRVVNTLTVPYLPHMDEGEYNNELENEAKKYLAKLEEKLVKKGIVVESAIKFGNEANEILSYATQNKIDLIAMASHGHSMIERWLLGSVAEKVMRHATQPVLLIRIPFADMESSR